MPTTASGNGLLTITQSVGRKGVNQFDDSLAVQQALNRHIMRGQLAGHPLVPEDGAGGSEETIAAITKFQEKVIGLRRPDGRVDPPKNGKVGKSLSFLRRKPEKVLDDDDMLDVIADNLNEPYPGVNSDVWDYAMNSLVDHFDNRRIKKHYMMMICDYTRPMNRRRLWVFDMRRKKGEQCLIHTYALHGWKSAGLTDDEDDWKKMKYGNGDFKTSVGAYATGARHKAPTGKPWKYEFFPEGEQPPIGQAGNTVYLHGLDPTNDRAYKREVLIHGGFAFNEDGTGNDFSSGCIVTNPLDNERICDWMHNGAFVFVFGGVRHMHNANEYS